MIATNQIDEGFWSVHFEKFCSFQIQSLGITEKSLVGRQKDKQRLLFRRAPKMPKRFLCHTPVAVGQFPFKSMRLPVMNLSGAEIEAYVKDPANKPKIDFKPRGVRAQLSKIFNREPHHPKLLWNFLNSDSAGVSFLKTSKQIIGGCRAALTQFPWQIYMLIDNSGLCGGSLISSIWVLSAAHCAEACVYKILYRMRTQIIGKRQSKIFRIQMLHEEGCHFMKSYNLN